MPTPKIIRPPQQFTNPVSGDLTRVGLLWLLQLVQQTDENTLSSLGGGSVSSADVAKLSQSVSDIRLLEEIPTHPGIDVNTTVQQQSLQITRLKAELGELRKSLSNLEVTSGLFVAKPRDYGEYVRRDGSKTLTADWDAGSFEIRAQTLESDVATGTAPLTIASTTKVTNLNADLLDDQTGSYYLDSANFTGTNWTDLTDGGTTTLHTHTSGTASAITVANEAADTTCFPVFVTAATGDLGPKSNTSLTFNSATAAFGAVTLTSTVSTGTAPLTVSSTTKVTNLNADLLDDQTGSYYLDSANFTGTNWTDLTDGGDTTLHQHSAVTVANEALDATCFVNFTTAATGNLQPKTNAGLTFDSTSATLSATAFSGPLTGNVTGNASTATALQTPRTIGGTSFDGTANIVPSTITIANEATDTSCSIAFFTAATGDLQPKTNANLTFNSNTGVLTSASAVLTTADINGGTVDNAAIGGSTASTGAFTTLSASGQVTSTVTTGTAPLVIASTTKVTNLNVDSLDDQSGAYYLDSANFTGANWTDLTDGGSTTLHIHAATGITNFHALVAAHAAMRT